MLSDASPHEPKTLARRQMLAALAGLGIGTATFQRAVATLAENNRPITREMLQSAAWIADVPLSDEELDRTAREVNRMLRRVRRLRQLPLKNSDPPATNFQTLTPPGVSTQIKTGRTEAPREPTLSADDLKRQRPTSDDDLAFLSLRELAGLLRSRQVSSVELTNLYLQRLKTFQPLLNCVVTLTEELAFQQAERADRELRKGRDRGLLHGIPWGAKDLVAVPGYPTTWGAPQYRQQILPETATVARRLEKAGAVLVAKLSLGALAMGDRWFGGVTRNPWFPAQGSSGSSAGSASAVAAGLVGFSIGSETFGSIVSPSRRCGATGLRPTFGRVSRAGCMTLAWSLDKIGPICRTADDCALVFAAIHGFDPADATTISTDFAWPAQNSVGSLRLGYLPDRDDPKSSTVLQIFQELGVKLTPIRLPRALPVQDLTLTLDAEVTAAFDELIRMGDLNGLGFWPEIFRRGQFLTAVDYLRIQRIRAKLQRAMHESLRHVDAYVSHGDLHLTNLTGHPQLCQPFGYYRFRQTDVPTAMVLTGRLYGESKLLALGQAFQQAVGQHLDRPPVNFWLRQQPARAERADRSATNQ